MSFNPEIIAKMKELSAREIIETYRAIKNYTKKTTKKADLQKQIEYLLCSYEMLYNKLNKMENPEAPTLILDKSKLNQLPRDELYGIHMMFRKSMRRSATKQQAIDNLVKFSKQIQYFNEY